MSAPQETPDKQPERPPDEYGNVACADCGKMQSPSFTACIECCQSVISELGASQCAPLPPEMVFGTPEERKTGRDRPETPKGDGRLDADTVPQATGVGNTRAE